MIRRSMLNAVFSIFPYNIPSGCEIVVQTAPLGGVRQIDLHGTIRVCPDEPIDVVLNCEEGKSCFICSLDAVCP